MEYGASTDNTGTVQVLSTPPVPPQPPPPPKKSIRDVIRHFTPAWFAVNMGTGVVSSIFHAFPYGGNTKVMNIFALIFFFINVILFIIFLGITILRYIMFPRVWGATVFHPVQSLYIGTFPMGAVTIVSSGVSVVHGYWGFGGAPFLYFLWAFWWLVNVISFMCCFGLLFIMTTCHRHSMKTLTPLWLLPIITLIVASSPGQLLATELRVYSEPHALLTIGVSAVMVVIGISLAVMVLTLYLRRLLIEGLPEVSSITSSFMPLGPYGQAGYSILLAGQNFQQMLPYGTGTVLSDPLSGRILNVICFFTAFVLWCLGVWWLGFAVITVLDTLIRSGKIPFKLSFWGLVFPNGVQATLTIQLGEVLDSTFFRVIGAIYGAAVILLWLALGVPTLLQVFDKSIFDAPGLEDDLMQPSNRFRNKNPEKAEERKE